MPTCETWLEPPVIPVARWGDRGEEQGLGLRMRSGVPGLVGAGGRKRQDEGRASGPSAKYGKQWWPGWVLGLFGSWDASGRGAGWLMLW